MTHFHTLSRVAAIVAAGLLAACGGGSEPAPTAPTGPTPQPTTPVPPPVSSADFTLTLSTDKALVIQGHTHTVVATVARRAGFDGAVNVALSDLPAGVSASPVVIAPGATSATITLLAQPSAPHSLPTAAKAAGSASTQNGQNSQSVSKPLTVTVGGLPGMVDTSFNGGAQLTSVGEGEDYAFAMAVQADGKVVTVGRTATNAGGIDIAITRHLRDGTLDPGFGNGGKVITAIAPGRAADEGRAVLLQPDGKIVVGGYTDATGIDKDFLVVRYNADGSLDTGFGTGGRTITPIGNSTDQVYALVRQADGKIVAGGSATFTQTTGQDFALVRYNADGSLDSSFGNGGKVTTPIGSGGDLIYSVATQSVAGQERIVAVGGEGTFMAARYLPNGGLDTSFGSNGKIANLFTSVIGAARSVIVGADNKLVIGGHIGHEFSMVQLRADGSLDTAFGNGGKVTTAVSTANWDEATAVVRQTDGKLLVGGWVYDGVTTNGDFVVLRYNADGSADTDFGSSGRVITGVAPNARSDSGRALALQVDERVDTVRVLQAGEAVDGGNKFALLRYWL